MKVNWVLELITSRWELPAGSNKESGRTIALPDVASRLTLAAKVKKYDEELPMPAQLRTLVIFLFFIGISTALCVILTLAAVPFALPQRLFRRRNQYRVSRWQRNPRAV